MVHRAIRSIIRSGQEAAHVRRVQGAPIQSAKRHYPYDLEIVQALGQSCSSYERRAEDATRDVDQWLKCEYLQKHLGDSFKGVISSVTHFGLFVQITDLYIEGLIHITNLPHDYYEFDSINQLLTGQSTRRIFKTGDKAMVQVARVDLDDRKIDLILTNNSRDSVDESSSANSFSFSKDSNNKHEGERVSRNDLIRSGQNPRNMQQKSDEKINKQSRRPGAKKAGNRRFSGKKNPRKRR